MSQDLCSRGEIRTLYDLQEFLDLCLPVLIDPVIYDLYNRIRDLTQVMRRYICSHSDCDTGGSVYQQVRIPAGKNGRFLLGLVKVRYEIYRVLVDIRQHFDGHLCKTCLGISHGSCAVTVHGTEVSVSVNQRISCIPFLCQLYQRIINGAVTVRMIFTHGITDDTRAFTMWFIGSVIQLYHRVQDTSLNRFQSISYIRQRPGCDYAHGIIDIGCFHGLFQIYFPHIIKDLIVFHSNKLLSRFPATRRRIFKCRDSLRTLHFLR